MTKTSSITKIIENYDLILFDAYGVLIDGQKAFPEAVELLKQLTLTGHSWCVLSNDASKTLDQSVSRYRSLGLPIEDKRILTSGQLITDYLVDNDLSGAKSILVGGENVKSFVTDAGSHVIPLSADAKPDVLVLVDVNDEHDFLQSVDTLITMLIRNIDRGHLPQLVLANPDLIYPSSSSNFNLAAGGLCEMLERIIELKYLGQTPPRFKKLGKPYKPIFEKALKLTPHKRAIMIGDQLATDVAGAKAVGIDSAIVLTGITDQTTIERAPTDYQPNYVLENLDTRRR